MKNDNKVQLIIIGAMTLILGLALLSSIPGMIEPLAYKSNVVNETYNLTSLGCYASGQVNESDSDCNITVTNAPSDWRVEDCPLTDVVVTNYTGTELTESTDYNLYDSSGIIQMLDTTDTNSTNLGEVTKIDYSYCGDEYINSGWTRNLLVLLIGFFAITLVAVAISMLVKAFGSVVDF